MKIGRSQNVTLFLFSYLMLCVSLSRRLCRGYTIYTAAAARAISFHAR